MLDDKCTLGLLTKLRFYSDLYSKNSILTPTLMLNTWMEEEMLPVFRQAINIPVRSSEAECWHTLLDYVGIKSLIFMCFFVRVNQCNSLCQQTPHVGGQAVPCREWAGWGSPWVVPTAGGHLSCVAGVQPMCCDSFLERGHRHL